MKLKIAALLLLVGSMGLLGCVLRDDKAVDMEPLEKKDAGVIENNIFYFKDSNTGICFAALGNRTYGFRTTISITTVPCDKLPPNS